MRAGLAVLTALILVSPAHAACRKFAIWHYPQPQRCPVVAQVAENKPVEAKPKAAIDLPLFTVSKHDTIILTPKPGRTDEEGRADAIEILKEVMGK